MSGLTLICFQCHLIFTNDKKLYFEKIWNFDIGFVVSIEAQTIQNSWREWIDFANLRHFKSFLLLFLNFELYSIFKITFILKKVQFRTIFNIYSIPLYEINLLLVSFQLSIRLIFVPFPSPLLCKLSEIQTESQKLKYCDGIDSQKWKEHFSTPMKMEEHLCDDRRDQDLSHIQI